MTQEMETKMQSRLEMLEKMDVFKGKRVVIFGCNEPAEWMIEYLSKKHISVSFIVDNNEKKRGLSIKGVSVYFPKEVLIPKQHDIVILIVSRFYAEMVSQLGIMGYNENIEVWNAYSDIWSGKILLTEERFDETTGLVMEGHRIYEEVSAKYDYPDRVFVCKISALGDIYLSYALIREYADKHHISSYIILVPKGPFKKLAELFKLENRVEIMDEKEQWRLIYYATFSDMADGKIMILNHKHPYTRLIGEVGNYKHINFTDMFRYGIFELDKEAKLKLPVRLQDAKEYVDTFFIENDLIKGKTVILMPYAKTSSQIGTEFWEEISVELTRKGYVVCTNSCGESEPVIKNTKGVFFDIRYALDVVEAAGTVISLRSGMCDVISSANTKKIILYPDRIYGVGKFFDYYSLKKMELSDDAVEYVWEESQEKMIEKVLSEVGV